MIYLASPYTDRDMKVIKTRYRKALATTLQLIEAGEVVFSPVVYGHHMFKGLPFDHPPLLIFNNAMIRACDEFRILRLEGWEESIGIKEESKLAAKLGKHISWMDAPGSPPSVQIPMGSVWQRERSLGGECFTDTIRIIGNAEGQGFSGLPWNGNWEILAEYVKKGKSDSIEITVKELKENWTRVDIDETS